MDEHEAAREALEAKIAELQARPLGQKKWPYVVLVAFIVVGGSSVIALANYHSHAPFCRVAWDAWMSLDKYRSHQMSASDTVNHLDHDLASMRFHLDALRRAGETKRATEYATIVADVSTLQKIIDSGHPPDYSTFAAKDLPTALATAGCRGFAPH